MTDCCYHLVRLTDNAITTLEFPSISKVDHELSVAIHNAFFLHQSIAYRSLDTSACARYIQVNYDIAEIINRALYISKSMFFFSKLE